MIRAGMARVDTVRLQNLSWAFTQSAVLFGALEADVFTKISQGAHTLAALEQATGIRHGHVRRLLVALVSLDLVRKQASASLRPTWALRARQAVVRGQVDRAPATVGVGALGVRSGARARRGWATRLTIGRPLSQATYRWDGRRPQVHARGRPVGREADARSRRRLGGVLDRRGEAAPSPHRRGARPAASGRGGARVHRAERRGRSGHGPGLRLHRRPAAARRGRR
jgi:hypothetical protein